MAAKKSTSKKTVKKDDTIDVKIEELMPQRTNISIFCRLFILLSFSGIALLIYDKIEPGKIPFFAEEKPQICEANNNDVVTQVEEVLSNFTSQFGSNLKAENTSTKNTSNFEKITNAVNRSKNEIIRSVSTYLQAFKDIELKFDEANNVKDVSVEKVVAEAKEKAIKDSKSEIVINLVHEKLTSLLNKKSNLDEQKKAFRSDLKNFKNKILFNKAQNIKTETEENKISSSIKNALGKFVKVKKLDEKKLLLEQLFFEAEESLKLDEFDSLVSVLKELKMLTTDNDVEDLIFRAESLEGYEVKSIKENLQEILLLVEKIK